MSVDSVLIKYIRDQADAGYSEGLIRDALQKQGWRDEEIEEAFTAALSGRQRVEEPNLERPSPKPVDVVKEKVQQMEERKAKQGGFGLASILGIAGGLIILVNAIFIIMGMGDILKMILPFFSITLLTMLGVSLSLFESFLLNMIVGIGIVACSVLGAKDGKGMLSGIVIISLGVMSLIVGNGFMIGALIAMIGGALLASKS